MSAPRFIKGDPDVVIETMAARVREWLDWAEREKDLDDALVFLGDAEAVLWVMAELDRKKRFTEEGIALWFDLEDRADRVRRRLAGEARGNGEPDIWPPA